MQLKIVCFEDNPNDQKRLQRAFKRDGHEVIFCFYENPQTEWSVTSERAEKIAEFGPDLVIVDLRDEEGKEPLAGLRTIRQLKEHPKTSEIPLVTWSVLFRDTVEGRRFIKLARQYDATPVRKSAEMLRRIEHRGYEQWRSTAPPSLTCIGARRRHCLCRTRTTIAARRNSRSNSTPCSRPAVVS
jgi:CheY-like chemotaxis protein